MTNYIEEVAQRIWAESGRDDYELEELVETLKEVDRRAREEVVEEMDRCDSCAFNPCEKHKRPITRVETKADWLRSEIEKLEEEKRGHFCTPDNGNDYDNGAWDTLTSIITRYKEELKVLEGKI